MYVCDMEYLGISITEWHIYNSSALRSENLHTEAQPYNALLPACLKASI